MQLMQLYKILKTMVYIKIGIQDFITEENFRKLQEKFMLLGDNADHDFELKHVIDSETLSVNLAEQDINGLNPQLVTIHFLNDFLRKEIPKLGEYHLSKFIEQLSKQYTPELKNGLASELLNKVRNAKNSISKAKYLHTIIQSYLAYQLDYIEEGLENYLKIPYPTLKQKLEFYLQRNEVIMLFHLLREKKVICHIEDSDLGRVIDNFAEYSDSSSKKFIAINNSRKELNNYKNFSKSDTKPLQNLQSIFTSSGFFMLP